MKLFFLLLAAPAIARPSRCKPSASDSAPVLAPSAPVLAVDPTVSEVVSAVASTVSSAVPSAVGVPDAQSSWLSSISYAASETSASTEIASVTASASVSTAASEYISEAASTVSAAPTPSASTASASASVSPTSSAPTSTASSTWDYLSATSYSGTSTFYGGNLNGGNCLFSTMATLPAGIYGTAYSGAVWDSAAECGACIEVTGPGGTIKAMIVDQCPECEQGHLDLFPDAFTAVGGTAGLVDTTYRFVACGITSPLILHNKDGTSAYHFSMQVVNANEPVAALEVSTDGGNTWSATTRTNYNFFEYAAGFGDAFDVRVTSITGRAVTYKGATADAGAEFTADSNF